MNGWIYQFPIDFHDCKCILTEFDEVRYFPKRVHYYAHELAVYDILSAKAWMRWPKTTNNGNE